MLDLLITVLNMLAGSAITYGIFEKKGWIKKPHKYRFVCLEEGCTFSCSANDEKMLNHIASNHENGHNVDV